MILKFLLYLRDESRIDFSALFLVREVAGGHHEGEEERLVVGVGGIVPGGDHPLEVGTDAQVVRQVGR